MGATFTFRYFPSVEEIYEVEEAASDFFVSLFDADAEMLAAFDLFPCFVREYRLQTCQTKLEFLEVASEQDILKSLSVIPDDPTSWKWDELQWGPSSPFEPDVAQHWAEQWINWIQDADEESLVLAFPYTLDIRTGKSTLHKQCAIEDLQKITSQAKCAFQEGAYMTVEAIWA